MLRQVETAKRLRLIHGLLSCMLGTSLLLGCLRQDNPNETPPPPVPSPTIAEWLNDCDPKLYHVARIEFDGGTYESAKLKLEAFLAACGPKLLGSYRLAYSQFMLGQIWEKEALSEEKSAIEQKHAAKRAMDFFQQYINQDIHVKYKERAEVGFSKLLVSIAANPQEKAIAISRLETAVLTYPNSSALPRQLGLLLMRAGRVTDALAAFDTAVLRDGTNSWNHLDRGTALARLGRYEEACQGVNKALELDPQNKEAHKLKHDLGCPNYATPQ